MEGKVLLAQYLIWVMILLAQIHGYRSCILKERNALLELKTYLLSRTIEGYSDDVLPTWTNDTRSDCCRWNDIKCNRTSGRVIELSIGTPFLKESSLLNLSLLHPFEEVQSLDLSHSLFSGLFDDVEGYKSLIRLRNLEIMNLSSNRFNNNIFPFLNAATSLTALFLRSNIFDGPLHVKELKDLKNLEVLDLSENRFNGSIPIREFTALRKLKALDLSDNGFSGSIKLQGVCKLKNIEELLLSNNKFVGQFPSWITNLTGLRVLDLSLNYLTGRLPDALSNLESLEYLSLLDNNFESIFSLDPLTNLSELKVLILGSTFNSLKLELKSSWKPNFQLSVISLKACNLEKVPHFLLYQKDLRLVDLSDNQIYGKFPYWLLENNTKLEVLLLRNNSFTSFQLPSSLGNMKSIRFMDISHNNFHGKLPRSFLNGCYSLESLDMSHNNLSGEIFQESANFTRMYSLSMDNNQFSGNIGQGLRSLRSLSMLDISNNNLTGVIPSWIGELPELYALLLSKNSLEGEIPVSLFNISHLKLLDLSTNNLSGGIPSHVSFRYPRELLLHDNNLSGTIPDTLLVNVTMLDLRNNRLSGNISGLINTRSINILLLRGNNLTGQIPRQLCGLRNIQLLDLSNNRLTGSIPSCLSSTSFGLEHDTFDEDYRYFLPGFNIHSKSLIVEDRFFLSIEAGTQRKYKFATRQRYDAYWGTELEFLFGLDLSKNELSGEIPAELGGLLEVQVLNLSHNNLTGVIPQSFSSLNLVEALDLSFNRLQGPIPSILTDLSLLAVFNLSYNNLSGIIPQGNQFNTFETQSYFGNPLLCGKPTNLACPSHNFQETDNGVQADESTIDMVSFFWSFIAAYVTILVGIFASLSFDSPWSRVWFYTVDVLIHKVMKLSW